MLLLFPSAEVRWFFPGEPPVSLEQWFHQGNLWQRSSPRTDAYLFFPNSQTVGVKFREGRFEIKALVRDLGVRQFTKQISGVAEQWEKWSLDFGHLDFPPNSQWMEVEKSRTLRRFILKGEKIEEIKVDTYPDEGCNMELTWVKVFNQLWWSLALESFGKMERTELLLQRAAKHILDRAEREEIFPPSLSLVETHSLSYPSWLKKMATEGGN